MRRQRYLRTSSAQSLCLFCACRLTGDIPTLYPAATRRRLNTGRASQQGAGAAAAEAPSAQDAPTPTPQPHWAGSNKRFDQSTLTPAEKAERDHLVQRRLNREDQEEQQRAAQHAQFETWQAEQRRRKDQEERDRVQRQWRVQQEGQQKQQGQHSGGQHRGGESGQKGVIRKLGGEHTNRAAAPGLFKKAESKRPHEERSAKQSQPAQQQGQVRSRQDTEQGETARQQGQRKNRQEARRGPTAGHGLNQRRLDLSGHQQSRPPPRREKPFLQPAATAPAPKAAMPTFGTSASTDQAPRRVADVGWGSGNVQRKPLQRDEGTQRRQDEALAERAMVEESPRSNTNVETTERPPSKYGYKSGPFEQPGVPQRTSAPAADMGSQRNNADQDPMDMWEQRQAPSGSGASPRFQGSLQDLREPEQPNRPAYRTPFQQSKPHPRRTPSESAPHHIAAGAEDQLQRPDTRSDVSVWPRRMASKNSTPSPFPDARPSHDRHESYESRPNSAPPPATREPRYKSHQPDRPSQASRLSEPWMQSSTSQSPWSTDARRQSGSHKSGWHDDVMNQESPPPSRPSDALHDTPQNGAPPGDFGSSQPPPPPPDQPAMYNNSGYCATILDPQEYQDSQQPFDEAPTGEWQHLRRRDSAPAQPPPAHAQPRQPPQEDTDWIDRQFNQHKQERQQHSGLPAYLEQQQPQQYQPYAPDFDLRATVKDATKKCARCLEPGHLARECTGPVRATCHACGQVGHMLSECPTRQRARDFQGARRTQSEPRQQYEAEREQKDFDPFAERPQPKFGRQREPEGAVEDMRRGVLGKQQADEAKQADEVPEERVLRSRKFAEPEGPKAKVRGRRRDEDEDDDEGAAEREERNSRKAARKVQKAEEKAAKEADKKAEKVRRAEQGLPVKLPEFVSVATLGQQLGVRYEQFVGRLEKLGYDDVFPGKVLNSETSGMIAMEYGFEPVFGEQQAAAKEKERDLRPHPEVADEDKDLLPSRPPVVTIMGHVDHGKTTILDYLRKSSVAAGEAGGITQHIGAFSVPLASSGKTITFLDTPGHAAFLAMRQRGAHVTDIVILVVAADDSVKPQTIEAIKHAQAANVPMIVAVNKIDKEEADLQRVKQDLARHGVEIEDFGGETQVVAVSGKTGAGMEGLEEVVVTLSEILDFRAETEGAAEGWVLEATTKKAGRVATVLVRRGTLRPGCVVVAGKTWARVRTLKNEAGQSVREVGPGMPVEVDGWRDQPAAGDEVLQAPSEQKATDVVEFRLEKVEQRKTAEDMEAINLTRRLDQERQKKERAAERAKKSAGEEAFFEAAAEAAAEEAGEEEGEKGGGQMTVPFIIKTDVSGSAEAVSAYILSVASPLIAPQILRSEVGAINESDVDLADAARGHIIAFNLPPDEGLKALAQSKGVKVLENNIIYRVLDDVKGVMEAKLPPIVSQRVLGEAEVSAAFEIGVGGRKKVKIAGCKIRNGLVSRGSRARVTRGRVKVFDGVIQSLKNVKKDVQEMRKGTECGMGFEGWEAFEVGDQVQTYEEVSERRKL